jgi:hypothetical protein
MMKAIKWTWLFRASDYGVNGSQNIALYDLATPLYLIDNT